MTTGTLQITIITESEVEIFSGKTDTTKPVNSCITWALNQHKPLKRAIIQLKNLFTQWNMWLPLNRWMEIFLFPRLSTFLSHCLLLTHLLFFLFLFPHRHTHMWAHAHAAPSLNSCLYPTIYVDHPGHLFPGSSTGQDVHVYIWKMSQLPEEVEILTPKLRPESRGRWGEWERT